MAELTGFFVKDFPACRAVGKSVRLSMEEAAQATSPIRALWCQCFEEGAFNSIMSAGKAVMPECVGLEFDYDFNTQRFTYMVCMFLEADTPVPEGLEYRDLPASRIAVSYVTGEEHDVYPNAYDIASKAIAQNGHRANWTFWAEVYNYERFMKPQETGSKIITLDFYVPIEG